MRRGEVLNLRWEDIDFRTGVIFVRDSNNYETRAIPISDSLNKTLTESKKNSDNEYLFSNRDSSPIESVNRSFQTAVRCSGIAHCTFHSLRHTFATRAVMAGVDIVTVQELLGHKTIAMTKRYSHPTPEHKKRAVELVSIDTSSDTIAKHSEVSNVNIANITTLN